MNRTCYAGEVNDCLLGKKVTLCGWVQRQRDLGGVIFIDLRDRSGIFQIVFEPESCEEELLRIAKNIRSEFIIEVVGIIRKRSNPNPNLPTGYLEMLASELTLLNESETPPFLITDNTDAKEDLRLVYRFLDLRRPFLQKNVIFRHEVVKAIREFLYKEGFIEIETPMLIRSTPEGARDYIVPSRIYQGKFYALPQSPQLFKQLSMIAGFDKYFQIARCFRDEDSRSDRQPEFTQLDLEMSFVNEEDIYDITERLFCNIFKTCLNVNIQTPFQRISYLKALTEYGTDKPDIRFEMKIEDYSDLFKESSFPVFQKTIEDSGRILGIKIADGSNYSRKEIENLQEWMKEQQRSFRLQETGFIWLKSNNQEIQGTIKKYVSITEASLLNGRIKETDLLVLLAGKESEISSQLGVLRNHIAKTAKLIDKNDFKFCWITDFPLFKWNEEEQKIETEHHPFTQPNMDDYREGYLSEEKEKALKCRARCYDLVLNGIELSSGSIRNHDPKIQYKILEIIGMSKAEIDRRFGFLLDALKYGAPPHGGIAPGIDRLVMIMLGLDSLRDVYAFPKTSTGLCLMTKAPSEVDKEQLAELGINLVSKNVEKKETG
ncbi:MAG: aspartate--tRNA ligase [Candidatus Coatesbacteria bacterium]|nr:aspartate--tRNA ligase [Candidatus Coatesbacteria bacterium]